MKFSRLCSSMTKHPKATNHALPSLQKSVSIFSAPNPKLRNRLRGICQVNMALTKRGEVWHTHFLRMANGSASRSTQAIALYRCFQPQRAYNLAECQKGVANALLWLACCFARGCLGLFRGNPCPNFRGGPKPVPTVVSTPQLEPDRYHESRCCKHDQSWPCS